MRHLRGQGDKSDWTEKRQCGRLNPMLHRLACGNRDVARSTVGVSLITQVSSPKLVILPSCNFHNVHVDCIRQEKARQRDAAALRRVDRALLDGLGDKSHFTLFLHLPLLLWRLGRNKQRKARPTSHKHNDDDEHMDRFGPCPYRLPQLRDANTTSYSLDLNTNTYTHSVCS